MLKSLSDTCLTFIVDLFNDIQIAAEIPILWKKGLVTLQLKKAPATLLKNYRPITLISCVFPQEKLHLGSIDLSAAYDTVNREIL